MGLEGIFGIPLDVAATYIVLFTLYGAVLEYSGAARFFVAALVRRVRREPDGPGADDDAGRLPARHRVGLRRRDDGHARLRHVAAAAQGRLSEGRGRRHPRRCRHRRDPVAADARRRRVHHRRVPGGELLQGAPLRGRAVAPLLPRDPAGDRDRRAPLQGARARPRDARVLEAARPLGLPLLVADRDRAAARDRDVAVPRRALRDRAGVPDVVPGQARPHGARASRRAGTGARGVLPIVATTAAAGIIVAVVSLPGSGSSCRR